REKPVPPAREQRITGHEQGTGMRAGEAGEGALEIPFLSGTQDEHLLSERLRRGQDACALGCAGCDVRVLEHPDDPRPGDDFAEQLQLLLPQAEEGDTRDVSPGSVEAADELIVTDGVSTGDEDDRDREGGHLGGLRRPEIHDQYRYRTPNQ